MGSSAIAARSPEPCLTSALDGRLENGRDDTWLAGQSLYASTTFCRLLGSELVRLKHASNSDSFTSLRSAQIEGFRVAAEGPKAISSALGRLAADASASADLPHKAFGGLYRDLARAHLKDEAFHVFRRLVWDRIIATWPVAPGETILGFTLHERKLHSLATAAKETGVGEFLLDQLLIEAGAYDCTDTRPAARKTFDATEHAALLAEAPKWVGPLEMQRAMGTTKTQFNSLVEDGLLAPRTKISTIKSPWRLQDGLEFLKTLTNLATSVARDEAQWEQIQQAKKRSGLGVGCIIQAIFDGRIGVARFGGLEGYKALSVRKIEIDQLASQHIEVRGKRLSHPPEVVCTAAAFGRSVGMRENQAFQRLVKAGHARASHAEVAKNGSVRFYVTQDDTADFHRRFFTQKTLADQYGGFWRTLVENLLARGVERFSVDGESFGNLFLRADVERELGQP